MFGTLFGTFILGIIINRFLFRYPGLFIWKANSLSSKFLYLNPFTVLRTLLTYFLLEVNNNETLNNQALLNTTRSYLGFLYPEIY